MHCVQPLIYNREYYICIIIYRSVCAEVGSNELHLYILEMWVFPLKFKEKNLVKKKVIQKAS